MLTTGPLTRTRHILLAHGAGAPMTSPFLESMASRLDLRGITVHRFEFPYMAARRTVGVRRPAPKAETLRVPFFAALAACRSRIPPDARVVLAGKSMGGRVATMIADGEIADPNVVGVAVFGYPFHPPRKPDALRLAPLMASTLPVLIVQGTRDPLGTREEIAGYALKPAVRVVWIEDGDHDLRPRRASGLTHTDALDQSADAVAAYFARLETRPD